MAKSVKLYQILEKASIDTKIGVEIQDWIMDTIEEKRELAMNQFHEAKLLPIHQEMRLGFETVQGNIDSLRNNFESLRMEMDHRFASMHSEMNTRFGSMQTEMNARFDSLEKRLDSTNFSIRLLGVPIVGATVGGLGIIFLQIYQKLAGP